MSNWTQADLDRLTQKRHETVGRLSKYRNVKCEVLGEKFDSKREGNYWLALKAREAAGEITDIRRQVSYPLFCPTRHETEMAGVTVVELQSVVARYIADFVYKDNFGTFGQHVVDAKGHRTAIYQLKKKWLELQDGIVIEEI